MPVTVRIPTPLRPLAGGAPQVHVEAATVREVVAAVEEAHPGFADRLLDDDGELRRFVNVFVRDEDIRYQKGLDTEVRDGDVVSVVPAVAGGAGRRPVV
jgi:sulfur-carrier protein